MADVSSELPIRSQLPGQTHYDDILVKIADGTAGATQLMGIDSSGRVTIKLDDGAGNAVTSRTNGAHQALDTFDQSLGPVTPGTVAAFSSLFGGQFNTALPVLTTGQQAAIQVDSSGRLFANVTNLPLIVDTNYGVVGASTLRAAAQIGNATGAADFNFAAATAQTLRVAALLGNASGLIDYNYGTIDGQAIRTASQIGNATGAADFNNAVPTAQTLRVAAQLAVGGANVSGTNPIPVALVSAIVGTSVNNYNTAVAVAAAATSNHIYTITTAKTFSGKKIHASASGKLKIEVRISPDGTTYSTLFVGFNSTANPNIDIDMDELVFLESGTGATIEVIRTNMDLLSQDVYSTISGTEA